ncbi:MAG: hypothetical protein WCK60_03030 [Candidatus Nomurabacteria bacterium]
MILYKVTTKPIHGEDPVDMAKRVLIGLQVLTREILKRGGCPDEKSTTQVDIKWTLAGELDVMASCVLIEVTTDFDPWVISENSYTAMLHAGLIGLFPELSKKLTIVFVQAKILAA